MSNETISLVDYHMKEDQISWEDGNLSTLVKSRLRKGGKYTKIRITDHETGEVLQDNLHNKILVPGSQLSACKEFGINPTVLFPSYNKEMGLENSHPAYDKIQPFNEPIVCLWCVGRSGGLNDAGEILACKNTDRIEPVNDMLPFRYVSPKHDLSRELREHYFGRKVDPETGMISYYFKALDTTPQLHVRYLDGTEVLPNMYKIDSSQQVEVYVETRLAVTRLDFRDYFDRVLGWDNADISTLGLVTAWYDDTIIENPDADKKDQYCFRWYQDILPYSKLNFKNIDLYELNKAIDFNYQIFY